MSPRGRKKQFEQLKEQVMWKKQLKIKKQKKEVETSPILELLSLIFLSPTFFLFKLIFHSGWAKPRMVSHPNSQGWVFTTSAMTEVQPELSRSSQKANKFLVFTVSSLKPNFTQFKLPKILKEMIKHVFVLIVYCSCPF